MTRRGALEMTASSGVRHEEVDAGLAEAREGAQVGDAVVERQLVHLEVAGVQHAARLGLDGDGQRVRDGVVDGHELELERPEALAVALLHLERVRLDPVLLELRLDEGEREAGADQRDVLLQLEEVRHRADVVLVAVREDDAHDVVEAVRDGGEVGEDQVDARLVLLGEEHAAVDDEDLAVDLERGHVAPDLAQAADGRDAQGAGLEGGGIVDGLGHGTPS
jgi:hypothetical protein